MAVFAKLFYLENSEQVLVTLDFNVDDDVYELEVKTDLEDILASIKMGYNDEDKAKNALSKFDESSAIKFRAEFEKMLK